MATRVDGFGPMDAKICVIGEAPGKDEEIEGKPFVGASGRLLRDYLKRSGIDPESVRYNNICKYRPPGNQISQWFEGGIPNDLVLTGMEELQDEINRIQPNVVMCCGSHPLYALTQKASWNQKEKRYTGIANWRGSILDSSLCPGVKVVPTYHPAYILREGYSEHGIWQADISRVREQSLSPVLYREADHKRLIIDPRGEELLAAKSDLLNNSKIITFDIEYIGEKLLCVGMTNNSDGAYCFVIRQPSDLHMIREILLSGIPLCAQNAMFDCSILEWWYDIPCMKYIKYDTMLAQHAANIELPKGLDFLTSLYTDQPYYKDMISWKAIKDGKQDVNDVWLYNCIDVWVTHKIMEEQLKDDLVDQKVRDTFEFEQLLVSPLWEMSKLGVRIDVQRMKELDALLYIESEEMNAELNALAGSVINVKSTQQVGKLLFDQLAIPRGPTTPGGQAQVDDKTLAALDGKCTHDLQRVVIRLIRDIRERRDLRSKFCAIQLEDDGRMRGHYNPAGTDTGRLASRIFFPTGRGGNQQNFPRDKRVRQCFIPDLEKRFGYADLERAESFVVAHITHDPMMLANHMPGVDAHKRVGAFLFGVEVSNITKDQRYLAKRTAHAGNYMMGPRRFMEQVNADTVKTGISLTFSEAKRLLENYKDYYSHLPGWWRETEAKLRSTRRLENLLGRPRQFFDAVDRCLPNAVAFVPQSTVGDALNVAYLNVHGVICPWAYNHMDPRRILESVEELKTYGFQPLMQIHDAIGYQFNEGFEEPVDRLLRGLMAVPLYEPDTMEEFVIPLENAYGPSWGDVEVYAAPN